MGLLHAYISMLRTPYIANSCRYTEILPDRHLQVISLQANILIAYTINWLLACATDWLSTSPIAKSTVKLHNKVLLLHVAI